MGRPLKRGLEYFPMDVHFFEDEKLEAIAMDFGCEGEITTIKLLCLIYRNGYYIEWSEPVAMKMRRALAGMPLERIEQVIERLIKWQFFDAETYAKHRVLTSKNIQQQFREITKRRKQSNSKLPFWLLDADNATQNEFMHTINRVSANDCEERKGKEKQNTKENVKEKESIKENESISDACMKDVQCLMRFFGYNEQNNYNIMRQFACFIATLKREKRLEYFRKQFKYYREFKQVSRERIHSWSRFIGSANQQFADGGWDTNNWQQEWQKLKDNKQQQAPKHMTHKAVSKNVYNF